MKKRKVFYYEFNNEMVECNNLEHHGYFLSGFQNPEMKGFLYTMSSDCQLAPVYDENHKMICKPEYAGKDVKNLNLKIYEDPL